MIAICIFVLSIFSAQVVNANELDIISFANAVDGLVTDWLDEVSNIAAKLKKSEQPTLQKTINVLIPSLNEITKSFWNIIHTFAGFLENLENDNSKSSQAINIPAWIIEANAHVITRIKSSIQNIVNANAAKIVAENVKALQPVNGNIIISEARSTQLIQLLQYVMGQYEVLTVDMDDFKQTLLNIVSVTRNAKGASYATRVFKNCVTATEEAANAFGRIEQALEKALIQCTQLIGRNNHLNGFITIPATQVVAVADDLLNNIGGGFNNIGSAMVSYLVKNKVTTTPPPPPPPVSIEAVLNSDVNATL